MDGTVVTSKFRGKHTAEGSGQEEHVTNSEQFFEVNLQSCDSETDITKIGLKIIYRFF